MRCAVSFLTVIVLSVAVGLMALYIIWITENEDHCQFPGVRCLPNGKCIKPKQACNQIFDCPDGSDEAPIYCNDLTTTSEMLSMITECRNLTMELLQTDREKLAAIAASRQIITNTSSSVTNSSSDDDDDETKLNFSLSLTEKPEGCIFIKVNATLPAKGIKCTGTLWESVPWDNFDPFARTISIDNDALNTSVLRAQPTGAIREFLLLDKLYIDDNKIESVEAGSFCHMENVCWFSLNGNSIRHLSPLAFCPMRRLRMLKMSENRLTLDGFQFKDMPLLRILHLDQNHIEEIHETTLSQLHNLKMFNISHNKIKYIHEEAFKNNVKLIELDLTGNNLLAIPPTLFHAQLSLTKLYISSNPNLHLVARLFAPLSNLTSLKIESLDISQIDVDAFKFTPKLDIVYFKKFSYCRYVPRARRCFPNSDGLSSTSNLLIGQSRIMVWFVGLVTLLGNVFVLANRGLRKRSTTEISEILNIFVTNLALADFLMGVYLLILACKDVQFRGLYSVKAYEWGTSPLCSLIGIIAMISSEVSLLILTIMSLERYLTIGGLFSQRQHLSINLAKASMFIIWIFAGILALAPAVQWQSGGNTAFYGSTGLCFPIHLDERYPIGWKYTTFVFIGVNSCCLVIITLSYSMLFCTVRKTQRKTPLQVKNIELAGRFFLMVITDVLCWAPIILLKISVLGGYELSKEIIGVAVIYLLPINSGVNPFIYTFSGPAGNDVRKAVRRYLDRLLENFHLHQLFPLEAQPNRGNLELEGIGGPRWMTRFGGSRRLTASDSGSCGVSAAMVGGSSDLHGQQEKEKRIVTASDDTELTHSICPTILTDNVSLTGTAINPPIADLNTQPDLKIRERTTEPNYTICNDRLCPNGKNTRIRGTIK